MIFIRPGQAYELFISVVVQFYLMCRGTVIAVRFFNGQNDFRPGVGIKSAFLRVLVGKFPVDEGIMWISGQDAYIILVVFFRYLGAETVARGVIIYRFGL